MKSTLQFGECIVPAILGLFWPLFERRKGVRTYAVALFG